MDAGIRLWKDGRMIVVRTTLLMLPVSSRSGIWSSFVDSLLTYTSAVCVIGLMVGDTFGHCNF